MPAYPPPPGHGSPPAPGYGSPAWAGAVPPARPGTPLALVGCAILTAVLVVVGSFPTFGETRVDDLLSGGSAWSGYSRAVGDDEMRSYSAPGQGVMLVLAAVVLLIGVGLLIRPALRSTGAAVAVLGGGLVLGVVVWRFLALLGVGNSVRARVPEAEVTFTLGLGGWLQAVAALAAMAVALLGIAAVRRAEVARVRLPG